MTRKKQKMHATFGDERTMNEVKETLLFYGVFDELDEELLARIVEVAEERGSHRLVLYPFHDATLRRMGVEGVPPYHRRVKILEEWLEEDLSDVEIDIDRWDGKRKKYTPVEASVRFIMEKHGGRLTLVLTTEMANRLVGYHSFDEISEKVGIIVFDDGGLSPRFREYEHVIERVMF